MNEHIEQLLPEADRQYKGACKYQQTIDEELTAIVLYDDTQPGQVAKKCAAHKTKGQYRAEGRSAGDQDQDRSDELKHPGADAAIRFDTQL